ncbi:hypothetical protein TRFO_15972 [Tritrichomonas foetus]|uniref:Uncharacterized protein n=1 Tax=Tritrichomonas foetus TaxID=1144522 RepID=A0A1J4KVR1_9EUKA|nr:hypothetical protein TRFO_15972 [Tritrichomonas foetus]|eukprot:OHT13836.1 hypothetical protein TRFO_15972 [Tritrichomonas foetus]
MISSLAIEAIKKNVAMILNETDNEEVITFLETFDKDPSYLPTYHEIISSEENSLELHFFAFSKISNMIENISENWLYSDFVTIFDWLNEYLLNKSNFLKETDNRVFLQFINCYLVLFQNALKYYPDFKNLFTNISNFIFLYDSPNLQHQNNDIIFVALSILRELSFLFETQYRKILFDCSIRIIEHFDEPNLIMLGLETVSKLNEFLIASHFPLFFELSLKVPNFEICLQICEKCLTEGQESDFIDIIDLIEDKMYVDLNDPQSLLKFHYLIKFIHILFSKNIDFTDVFIENLERFTVDSLKLNMVLLSPESTILLMNIWKNFRLKPKKIIRESYLNSIFESIGNDTNKFSDIFLLNESNYSIFITILPSIFRNSLSTLIFYMVSSIYNNMKKGVHSSDEANQYLDSRTIIDNINLSVFIRILTQIIKYQIALEGNNIKLGTINIIFSICKASFELTDIVLLSILLFFNFFVSINSYLLINRIGNFEYEDKIETILHETFYVLKNHQSNKALCDLAIRIISKIVKKKEIFFDLSFMRNEEIDFDLIHNFQNASAFSEYVLADFIPLNDYNILFQHLAKAKDANEEIEIENSNYFRRIKFADIVFMQLMLYAHFCGKLKSLNQKNQSHKIHDTIHIILQNDYMNFEIHNQNTSINDENKEELKRNNYNKKMLVNYLYPTNFELLCRNASKQELQYGFLSFVKEFLLAIENSLFPNFEPVGNKIFISTTNVITQILANNENDFDLIILCFEISVLLLKSDLIEFEAFVLYNDDHYNNFLRTISTEIYHINFDSLIEYGQKTCEIISHLFKALVKNHLYYLSENFDDFYISIPSYLSKIMNFSPVQSMKIIYKIINQIVYQFGIDSRQFLSIQIDVEEFIFTLISKYLNIDENIVDLQLLCKILGEFTVLDDQVIPQIVLKVETDFPVLEKVNLEKIIEQLYKEEKTKNMEALKSLFVKLLILCKKHHIII